MGDQYRSHFESQQELQKKWPWQRSSFKEPYTSRPLHRFWRAARQAFGWREVSLLFSRMMLIRIKQTLKIQCGLNFSALGPTLRSSWATSVHTQIRKLHLIDWDRLVLGMPRSNGQCSWWTRRRARREEQATVNTGKLRTAERWLATRLCGGKDDRVIKLILSLDLRTRTWDFSEQDYTLPILLCFTSRKVFRMFTYLSFLLTAW